MIISLVLLRKDRQNLVLVKSATYDIAAHCCCHCYYYYYYYYYYYVYYVYYVYYCQWCWWRAPPTARSTPRPTLMTFKIVYNNII